VPSEPRYYGKFELLHRIASGGMAEVWLGRSASIGGFEKWVAIKRLHRHLGSRPDLVSLFIEEAKMTVALSHPNIVQTLDFGEVDGDYYIALEYVDGVDLAMLMTRARELGVPLPVGLAVYVGRAVFDALAHAHGARKGRGPAIIHRDVSPHNVLLSTDGQVKLSDFGIAKVVVGLAEADDGVVGKSAYISPEQARGEPITASTDLWSAGVMLHELLVGRRLFLRESEEETLAAVSTGPIPAPSTLRADVPPPLDALVMSLLSRDPAARPESARRASEQLAEIARVYFPNADDYALAETLASIYPPTVEGTPLPAEDVVELELPLEQTFTGRSRPPAPQGSRAGDIVWISDAPTLESVAALKEAFVKSPNLWTLADIADVYLASGERARALGALKVAMAKFSQSGLLVQALTLASRILAITGPSERTLEEIRRLPQLAGLPDQTLLLEIFDPGDPDADFSEYGHLFGSATTGEPARRQLVTVQPVVSALDGRTLVELARSLRVHAFPAGALVLEEGSTGRSFFFVARGRVVVSAQNFEHRRVYLTALTDGDCFGEHAYFTHEPRNASVEASEAVVVVELEPHAIDALIARFPPVADVLLSFFKERVAESMLAKSALFGHLAVRDRRALASRFTLLHARAGELLLREGDRSDALYALKSGSVTVFTGPSAQPIELATLGPGEIFGEVAAVKGTPRTANVVALSDCELLKLEARDLHAFLETNPEIDALLERAIERRAEDTIQRLVRGG
jgi:serine/threonine protein kinase/CRP-like cAMP-binding protein